MLKKVPRMEKEFNSCLIIFEIAGLQYFSLKSLTKENANDKVSTLRTFGAITMLFLMTGLMAFCIYSDTASATKTITAKNVLMFAIQNSMNFGLILVVLTSLTQSYFTSTLVRRFFINCTEITRICLQEFNICINFKRIKKAAWKKISLISLFFVTTHGILIYFQAKTLTVVMQMLLIAAPIFFLLMIAFKFVFYVDIINNQLQFLNGIIKNIINNQPSKILNDLSFRTIPVALKESNHSSKNDTMRKLQVARKIYNLIYENGNLTNYSNGLSILVLYMNTVISLTASGYEAFVIVIGDQSMNRIPATIYVITNCLAILVSTIAYCQETCLVMTKIATTVNNIESENFNQLPPETREFAQNFFLQLVHQPVVFTAYGFYVINLTLLASITTGIVSYIIILVQFYAS